MTPRIATATGSVLAFVGGGVLVAYMAGLGLDRADQLASVVSLFVGMAGLALAVYGAAMARRAGVSEPSRSQAPAPPRPEAPEQGVRNEISGTSHGPVFMGRDFSGPDDAGLSFAG